MRVIYVDTLFLLNGVVDYLLLLCAARVAGEELHRWRFALAAVLGGGYAVAIFLPGLAFLAQPACRLAIGVAMVLVAFSHSQRLLRQVLIFLALSCAFGGGVLAVSLLGGQGLALSGGVIYSGMDLKIVLLSAAGCYGLLSLLFRRWGRHTDARGELVPARLVLGDKHIDLTALVDTGNTLSDPISGQGAIVAEGSAVIALLPSGTALDLSDPAGTLAHSRTGALASRLRLLPYRAVGIERGLLLALRLDGVEVDGVDRGAMLVALSPTPVSDGGRYQVLVGPL